MSSRISRTRERLVTQTQGHVASQNYLPTETVPVQNNPEPRSFGKGRSAGFKLQPRRCRVTVLGKLFAPVAIYTCY